MTDANIINHARARGYKRKLDSHESLEDVVDLPIILPEHFKRLENIHSALNLFCTFCNSQSQVVTTFDRIRDAVNKSTPESLTVEDVAQIKYLIPESIELGYVDPDIDSVGSVDGFDEPLPGTGFSAKTKRQILRIDYPSDTKWRKRKQGGGQMLGRGAGSTKRGTPDPTTFHPVSLKCMNDRNQHFRQELRRYVHSCCKLQIDPIAQISFESRIHIPPKNSNTGAGPSSENTGQVCGISRPRPCIKVLMESIKGDESIYASQIVAGGELILPHQSAIYGELNFLLSQTLVDALYNVRKIQNLYKHQVLALNHIEDGYHVVVSTPTASGKSLIYQIPFLHELERNRQCRALMVFPTKALAQDQKRSLVELLQFMHETPGEMLVSTYDGDTPAQNRQNIRENARAILTNPDMLHVNILPNEEQWRSFLKNLRYVVIDEIHVYHGVFGSHVALIMRRFRRICSALGNNSVIFISCSATISAPDKHMKALVGLETVRSVLVDGSPNGEKTLLCWNCPLKDPNDPRSGRSDIVQEAARLFVALISRGVRTIAFCRVRLICELVLTAIKRILVDKGTPEVANLVMSYRGGYTAEERRNVESDMFGGKLLGIVATTALELGVDIGSLDAVLAVGFPYSISSLRQQFGRAGRRCDDSLGVLIGGRSPIDQHYMANPELLIQTPSPEIVLDLENILILEGHIQCAAFEMPLDISKDEQYFGRPLKSIAEERLIEDNAGFYHCNPMFRPYPSQYVNIRAIEEGNFAVINITDGRNTVLEEIEPSRALFTIYEGGIFLHQGVKYLVKDLNPSDRIARVEMVQVEWTTRQRDYTDIDPIEIQATRRVLKAGLKAYYGLIKTTGVVFGYFKVDRQGRAFDACDTDNPPIVTFSKGMWLDVPKEAFQILQLKNINTAASIHAAEHAILGFVPNLILSSVGDVKTECKSPQKEFSHRETSRKRPGRLIFVDSKGGAGITNKAFEFIEVLLKMALERVRTCCCSQGCPECVALETCKEGNTVISKAGSIVILSVILGETIDLDTIISGPEELAPGLETVVPATEIGLRWNTSSVIDFKR